MKTVIMQVTHVLNGPWLICCFIVILLYIERSDFLKEQRNCNWKLFLCRPQKQTETTAVFQNKLTL